MQTKCQKRIRRRCDGALDNRHLRDVVNSKFPVAARGTRSNLKINSQAFHRFYSEIYDPFSSRLN